MIGAVGYGISVRICRHMRRRNPYKTYNRQACICLSKGSMRPRNLTSRQYHGNELSNSAPLSFVRGADFSCAACRGSAPQTVGEYELALCYILLMALTGDEHTTYCTILCIFPGWCYVRYRGVHGSCAPAQKACPMNVPVGVQYSNAVVEGWPAASGWPAAAPWSR